METETTLFGNYWVLIQGGGRGAPEYDHGSGNGGQSFELEICFRVTGDGTSDGCEVRNKGGLTLVWVEYLSNAGAIC